MCKCKANKKALSASAQAVQKVRVQCLDCSEDLLGLDNVLYPVHLTPVIVSAQQVDAWKSAGYPIQILT